MNSPLSQNHYLYTHGNPVMNIDPSGHMTIQGMVGATVITGVLVGSYYATVGNPFSKGSVSNNVWLSIIIYELSSIQRDMEIWIMMAGILPEDRTEEEQKESDYDYGDYKNDCSNKPNVRDYPDQCSYLVVAIMHIKRCIKKNEDFDKKWTDNRHGETSLKNFKTRLKRLEDALKKECNAKFN
jgi:hypothetical protein